MNYKRIILTAVGIGLAILFVSAGGFNNLTLNSQSVWSSILGASAETDPEVTNYAVKKGDTFSTVMEKFGFSGDQANNILSEAQDLYDFTSITIGNIFQFIENEEGQIEEVRYDVNREDQIVVDIKEEGFEVSEGDINYNTEIRTASGQVNRSLFLDAKEAGLEDKTILEMAEIFAWDVDFAADIREGDEFSVVYRDLYRGGSYVGPGRILAAKFINRGDENFAFYFENGGNDGKYFDIEGNSVQRQFLKSPMDYVRISSGFSYNRLNPVTRSDYGPHRAIDYAAPPGTPIYSTGQGRVSHAGWGSGLGIYVKVSHGGVYDTVYAHMSSLARGMRAGVNVSQGQVLGYVGSTGYATGPHLHYEMHKYGQRINPLTHELPPGDPIKEELRDEFEQVVEEYKSMLE